MKTNKIFIFSLLILILGSCYQKQKEQDYDMTLVLSSERMTSLLTDMQLIDAAVSMKQRKGIIPEKSATPYFDNLLEEHQVSREEFEESMRYYAYHIDELHAIYEQVIVDLSKLEIELKAVKDSTNVITDSIASK